jgi:hypothetical protein
MTERRQDPRKLTCIFAGYEQPGDQQQHVALLHDVSHHGATLYTREELSVGEHLDLGLHLAEDVHQTSPVAARVVHSERRPWEGSDFWTWQAGIEFDESIEKYDEAIQALHARQRALGLDVP